MTQRSSILIWGFTIFAFGGAGYFLTEKTSSIKLFFLISVVIFLVSFLFAERLMGQQGEPSQSAPTPSSFSKNEWICLIYTFIIALGLRWIVITFNSHSYDYWRHYTLIRNIQEGHGFVGFASQPYLYLPPLWFYLASFLPTEDPRPLSILIGALTTIPIFLITKRLIGKHAALISALLWACLGLAIRNSTSSGGEPLVTLLVMTGWWLFLTKNRLLCLFGSFLFGLAVLSRYEALFLFPVVLFYMRKNLLDSLVFFLPVIWLWWRNAGIISQHEFIFFCDGIATRSDQYNWLSTLFPYLHPDVDAAWKLDHRPFAWKPEWWDTQILLLIGGFLFSKKKGLYIFSYPLLLYLFSPTLGRLKYLYATLPALIIGFSASVSHLKKSFRIGLTILVLFFSAKQIGFIKMNNEYVQVIKNLPLEAARYMVSSSYDAFPDTIQYLRPDKMFVGLPPEPKDITKIIDHYQIDWIILSQGKKPMACPKTVEFISNSPLFIKVREVPLQGEFHTLVFYKRIH